MPSQQETISQTNKQRHHQQTKVDGIWVLAAEVVLWGAHTPAHPWTWRHLHLCWHTSTHICTWAKLSMCLYYCINNIKNDLIIHQKKATQEKKNSNPFNYRIWQFFHLGTIPSDAKCWNVHPLRLPLEVMNSLVVFCIDISPKCAQLQWK